MTEPDLVDVPGGVLHMGMPEVPAGFNLPHRWVQQRVRVEPSRIGRCAVTVVEYLEFAHATGYAIAHQLTSDPRFEDPRAPAAYVSWIDAVRYVQWLGRCTGKAYRLIRDAEYEWAARGGLVSKRHPWGDQPPDGKADWNNFEGAPQPVGCFPANGYGLHDMVGSIWSWCEECFDQLETGDSAVMQYDDTHTDVSLNPVCRGGSYKTSNPDALTCAYRHEDPADGRFDCIGMRVALDHTG